MPLDIGFGILLAISAVNIFHVPLAPALVLWSIGFTLLPDIDVFPELIQRHGALGGKEIGLHREITHFPLTCVIPAALVFIFAGSLWGYLFSLGVLFHFLHDSVGMGWGIKWAWPFNDNAYKFFSNKRNGAATNFLVHWTPDELKTAVRDYGDPDWIKHYYLQLHPIVVFEIAVFVIAVVVLILKH